MVAAISSSHLSCWVPGYLWLVPTVSSSAVPVGGTCRWCIPDGSGWNHRTCLSKHILPLSVGSHSYKKPGREGEKIDELPIQVVMLFLKLSALDLFHILFHYGRFFDTPKVKASLRSSSLCLTKLVNITCTMLHQVTIINSFLLCHDLTA